MKRTLYRMGQVGLIVSMVLTGFAHSRSVPVAEGHVASSHPSSEKVLYFTFDDGPSQRYTPMLLDVLRTYHVEGTFFLLGNRCAESPWIVRRIRLEGHEIGSHGYDHQYILHKSQADIRDEVTRADLAIYNACGTRPIYYRPPGGLLDREERVTIHRLGHPIAMWTVDSQDWRTPSAEAIVRNVEAAAQPGSIILFHDGVSNSRYTIQALPTLIRFYRSQGYDFRTLPTD